MGNLSQLERDELLRLRDKITIAEALYNVSVMRIFAENRIDPRTTRLVVTDSGASFVKDKGDVPVASGNGGSSEGATASAVTASAGAAPKRGRGRPRKNAVPAAEAGTETDADADDNSNVIASTADLEPGVVHDMTSESAEARALATEAPAAETVETPAAAG